MDFQIEPSEERILSCVASSLLPQHHQVPIHLNEEEKNDEEEEEKEKESQKINNDDYEDDDEFDEKGLARGIRGGSEFDSNLMCAWYPGINSCSKNMSRSSSIRSNSTNSSTSSDGDMILMESNNNRIFQWRSLITSLIPKKPKKILERLPTFPAPMVMTNTNTPHPPPNSNWEPQKFSITRQRFVDAKLWHDNQQILDKDRCLLMFTRKPTWRSFGHQELLTATNYFNSERLIGKGGYAEVYKGRLADGQLVAVKRLLKKENEEERVEAFLAELGIIAHVNHPNAACLLGFGVDGGLHIILKYSPHGSLESVLHESTKERRLKWATRFKIGLGVAEGLLYLHRGCHKRIIHRDIKASNILLTQDYDAQISDFGLAKWLPDQCTHLILLPVEGTIGYLAPECFMYGEVSEKTDIFALGVLLFELVTGREAVDSRSQSLVMWVKPMLEEEHLSTLVDPSLGDDYDSEEMNRLIKAAAMCINHSAASRPETEQVVKIIKGEEGLIPEDENVAPNQLGGDCGLPISNMCDLEEEYTTSTYKNDLHRHRQLALEQ